MNGCRLTPLQRTNCARGTAGPESRLIRSQGSRVSATLAAELSRYNRSPNTILQSTNSDKGKRFFSSSIAHNSRTSLG